MMGQAAGTAAVTMEVKGRASHAGAAPELGRNAIIEIAHQMLQTKDIAKDIPGAQLNWTNVISNKATNQIPELATARAPRDGVVTCDAPLAQLDGSASGTPTSVTATHGTTTVAKALIVDIVAHINSATLSGWTNAGLASITERQDNNVASIGFGVATGVKTAAGSVSNTTATLSTGSPYATLTFALKP